MKSRLQRTAWHDGLVSSLLVLIGSSAAALAQGGLPYTIAPPEGAISFGRVVASGGDADGDGRPDIFVADPLFIDGADMVGKWYLYSGANRTLLWSVTGNQPFIYDANQPPTIAGAFIGDIDGDGRDDLIVGVSDAGQTRGAAYVYSGRTGAVLFEYHGSIPGDRLGIDAHGVDDIDGDHVPDFAFVTRYFDFGSASIRSGATGEEIHRFDSTTSTGPRRIRGAGDLNGDRVPDIVIETIVVSRGGVPAGIVWAISGATGDVLWFTEGGAGFGWSIATGVDWTNDTVPDVAAYYGPDRIILLSGATGRPVTVLDAPVSNQLWGSALAYGDVNGDGAVELVAMRIDGSYVGIDALNPRTARTLHWAQGSVGNNWQPGLTGNEMAVTDINGDGADDFIIGAFAGGVVVHGGGALLLNFAERRDDYNITRGQQYDFTVGGGKPGRVVHLLGSITGNGCTFIQQLGICIDLDQRIYRLGAAVTDPERVAHFTVQVPLNIPLGPIWLQAIDPRHPTRGPITSNVMQLDVGD